MKARPILFSAPMVRALLAGTKTQTRRTVKWPRGAAPCNCDAPAWREDAGWYCATCAGGVRLTARDVANTSCPYGQPGDLLWVRESGIEHRRAKLFVHDATPGRWWTSEDGGRYGASYSDAITRQILLHSHRVRPSIHMPRWASRLTLEITNVRVERAQAISDDDALAEGVREPSLGDLFMVGPEGAGTVLRANAPPLVLWQFLWRRVNGDASWRANPWVWVVEFRVHQANVDAVIAQRSAA